MHTNAGLDLDAALRRASSRIDAAEARLLLAHALQRPPAWLFAHGDQAMDGAIEQRFRALVEARAAGQPIAYLLGRRGFWTLELEVTPDTLVPRPETERVVELALARLPGDAPLQVADLGTGSGAIALAIAAERPHAQVVATDASAAALEVARANAIAHRLGNVSFKLGNWLQPLQGQTFDLIASNPPYIADRDPHLAQGDLRFEPAAALSSGVDGLAAIREIVAGAPPHLVGGGWLLLEHGWEQGAAVGGLMRDAGLVEIVTERDLEGRDRVTLGRRPL
ncbi:MAG TPA: peptide chain release factor N(5)-glutamine methyltransferase [Pseudoxanthomonas sp.]|nr:peptide chain release factor N(5)-glutamine methyltransferase [Pseudoxanthomonas sp.]